MIRRPPRSTLFPYPTLSRSENQRTLRRRRRWTRAQKRVGASVSLIARLLRGPVHHADKGDGGHFLGSLHNPRGGVRWHLQEEVPFSGGRLSHVDSLQDPRGRRMVLAACAVRNCCGTRGRQANRSKRGTWQVPEDSESA